MGAHEQFRSVFSIGVFLLNAAAFSYFLTPVDRGFIDELRGVYQWSRLVHGVSFEGIPLLRFWQVVITLLLLYVLVGMRLVRLASANFFLIWPYSAYLASKIKVEFIFFPLCVIRTDLKARAEIVLIFLILLTSYVLKENNGVIIAFFRTLVLVTRNRGRIALAIPALVVLAGFAIDLAATRIFPLVPALRAYNYTRVYVNPEYSVAETAAVLLSSLHLSIYVQRDWWFHLPFSIGILALSVYASIRSASPNWNRTISNISTAIFFTSVTHAFQNARYYYFFLLEFSELLYLRYFFAVSAISAAHVLVALAVYTWK